MMFFKGGGTGISSLILAFTFLLTIGLSTAAVCTYHIPGCKGPDCIRETKCINGECTELGECKCNPCYSGTNCDKYEDKHSPEFHPEVDTVFVSPGSENVIYRANAVDADLGTTCPLGAESWSTPCPCAAMNYTIRDPGMKDSEFFKIDTTSGLIVAKNPEKLKIGKKFEITIVASGSGKSGGGDAAQTLYIVVREPDAANNVNKIRQKRSFPDSVPVAGNNMILEEPLEDDEMDFELPMKSALEPHVRTKRSSAGADPSTTNLVLELLTSTSVTNSPNILPGNAMEYKLTIVLPTISTAMDLVVELFVMDAVSGITTLILCSPTVESIGSAIQDGAGATLTPAAVNVDLIKNAFLTEPELYDRGVIDFGQVLNTGLDDSGADQTDSTIIIKFTVVLINNPQYTNATVEVTAGAEYDAESYVWVSQASNPHDTLTAHTYPEVITMTGLNTVPRYGGTTFTITSHITNPYAPITIEAFTGETTHDLVSIDNLQINFVGANWACLPEDPTTIEKYKSVTGRTYHRMKLSSFLLLKNLDYDQLGIAVTDDAFKIEASFTVFAFDALEGDKVNVSAGIIVGTESIWTANVEVDVGPESTAALADPSWAFAPLSDTAVAEGGTATWGATATIPDGGNTLISCTASGGEVCGVNYGKVGANIACLPDLSELVVYSGNGVASFEVLINSTGAGGNDITFEISVHYPSGAPADVTLTCNGGTGTFSATATTAGYEDMSGVSTSLFSGSDVTWYDGSTAGLLVTLTFPANGVPYKSLILEAAGDLEVTGWGARVCKAEIVSAGRGVPCISTRKYTANQNYELQKARTDSVFDDSVKMDLGSSCGVNRDDIGTNEFEATIRVVFEMPPGQAAAVDGNYNVSLGINLDDTIIWTGWDTLAYSTGVPTTLDATKPSKFVVWDPEARTVGVGVPTLIKATLKIHPGRVGTFKIIVTSGSTATVGICRILILNIGSGFPCVDQEPYGKEKEPYQVTTIIHDPADWGLTATLDFKTLRNLRDGLIFADDIADEDSIHVAFVVGGVAAGASTLTIDLEDTGSVVSTTVVPITVEAPSTANTKTMSMSLVGTDGTSDAYDGVMKMIDVDLVVEEGYNKAVMLKVENTSPGILSLCFGAVFYGGKNIPCLIPHLATSTKTGDETMEIDLLTVCHFQTSDNSSENAIKVRVGVMFLPDATSTSGTVSVLLSEDGIDSLTPETITINKLGTAYVPDTYSTEGMELELADNETVTVTPGQTVAVAVAFTVPPFTIFKLEVGIMTPSDEGKAYVTVHGFNFRLSTGAGKNLGCLLADCTLYKPTIVQNSSFDIPMIHESQTDTLVADLGYITNTGVSVAQQFEQPLDNEFHLEAILLIADHTNATTSGDLFGISFAVKAGNLIFVIEKELTLLHTGAEAIAVENTLEIVNPPTAPLNPGDKLQLRLQMKHVVNISTEECIDAKIRIYLPIYVGHVNTTAVPHPIDAWDSSIPGVVLNTNYIDVNIDYLFFTDLLDVNFTLTADPNDLLPKGLGVVNATTIVRLVCFTNNDPTVRYVGNTSYVVYEINGPDCFDSLGVENFQDCQLSASTAIGVETGPKLAKSGSGLGWCPAVRTGSGWDNYITIDFLKKTRITKIQFQTVPSSRKVTQCKIQYSHTGKFFTDPCPVVHTVVNNEVILPKECRFEARYARLVVVNADGSADAAPICVRFQWYGCPIDTVDATCNPSLTTPYTDTTRGWRHVAYDGLRSIFYFCDFIPKKKRVQCYSTIDGEVWNALPSYIGRIIGYDEVTQKVCAMDRKERAMVCSIDGINWAIADSTTAAAVETRIDASSGAAKAVPGEVETLLTPVTFGPYVADFTGIMHNNVYKAKWSTCCS